MKTRVETIKKTVYICDNNCGNKHTTRKSAIECEINHQLRERHESVTDFKEVLEILRNPKYVARYNDLVLVVKGINLSSTSKKPKGLSYAFDATYIRLKEVFPKLDLFTVPEFQPFISIERFLAKKQRFKALLHNKKSKDPEFRQLLAEFTPRFKAITERLTEECLTELSDIDPEIDMFITSPVDPDAECPTCNSKLKLIERYDTYWCGACNAYKNPKTKEESE